MWEACEKGKKAFPSCRKQNSSVDAKPHTFEFQILARVEQQRPLFLCTCCSSKQNKCCQPGAEGKRLCRRSSTLLYKALPTAPSGCNLAPQASAMKEKLNPHIEGKPALPWACLAKTWKLPTRSLGGAGHFSTSLCWRSVFKTSSLSVGICAGFTCYLHIATDRIITCTHA